MSVRTSVAGKKIQVFSRRSSGSATGTNEAIAVDHLKSLLDSDDERVVLGAAQALSKIKTPAKPSTAAIVLHVKRPKENEEYYAAL